MKLKNREIHAAIDGLTMLNSVSLPMKASLQVVTLTRVINEPVADIENVRMALVNKYGSKNADDVNEVVFPDDAQGRDPTEGWETFSEEIEALMDIEVEVEFEKVNIPDMVSGQTFEIVPATLKDLEKFISIGGE